jgi:hypothetical protein
MSYKSFRHSRSQHGQNLFDFGYHAAVWNNKHLGFLVIPDTGWAPQNPKEVLAQPRSGMTAKV